MIVNQPAMFQANLPSIVKDYTAGAIFEKDIFQIS